MDRRLVSGLAFVAGLAAAACTERPQEQGLQGPNSMADVVPAACDPNAFNSLINNYFSPSKAQDVRGYKDAMIAALQADPEQTETAKDQGFNILREIGLAARAATQPPALTGSQLAVEVLECIYPNLSDPNVIKSPPGPTFFVNALTRDGGGFDVRGGPNDPTGPVQAFGGSPLVVISGAAPQTTSTWDGSLTSRVLFYGEPDDESGHHWDVVPRNSEFNPELIFTTCVNDQPDPNQPGDPSLMLTESDVESDVVLGFLPADHVGCGTPFAPVSAGRFNLLRHLASLGRMLLVPRPAAAAALMPGVVGGSAKGAKSHFDVDQVTDLDVVPDPDRVRTLVVNSGTFDLTVTVTEDDRLVNGATVVLSTGINSGAFNFIHEQQSNGTCSGGTPTKVTGSGDFSTGTVTFDKLCITQTGYVNVFINVGFAGRSGTGSATIERIKVTPPPKK